MWRAHIPKSKRCSNVKSSAYLCSQEDEDIGRFQICISAPLILTNSRTMLPSFRAQSVDLPFKSITSFCIIGS